VNEVEQKKIMMSKNITNIEKNLIEKTILVRKEFDAPLSNVWRAYVESELLEQWWGPSPWRAETKSFEFKVGGAWLYAMVSPEGEKHWAIMQYTYIEPLVRIEIVDAFCDDKGVINHAFPKSVGSFAFIETTNGVLVEFKMNYPSEQDILTLIEMGFEKGISVALDQLEKLLLSGF
jgi:uncharacterized protein YndB with AHSA1/START domain